MKKELIQQLHQSFEGAAQQKDGIEFWFARDLQILLGYRKWDSFLEVIELAEYSCQKADEDKEDHFVIVEKTIPLEDGEEAQVDDIMLTRYACYLITQNASPKKTPVAFAQNYFALQTRKQELLEQRIRDYERLKAREKLSQSEKELSGLIFQNGIDSKGLGRVRSEGDFALFGKTTKEMKMRLKISTSRTLADFLPTVTIKAKDFATEMTNFNIRKGLGKKNEDEIVDMHIKSNKEVRKAMLQMGIKPEDLPADKDIKKIEREITSSGKKILKDLKKKLNKNTDND